jgi:DNA-binding transcriptional MerR regulator
MTDLLSPRDAGAILGITTSGIIKLSRTGKLHTLRDSAGRRFFRPEDVEQLRVQREQKRLRIQHKKCPVAGCCFDASPQH